jgi:hypothetical protein
LTGHSLIPYIALRLCKGSAPPALLLRELGKNRDVHGMIMTTPYVPSDFDELVLYLSFYPHIHIWHFLEDRSGRALFLFQDLAGSLWFQRAAGNVTHVPAEGLFLRNGGPPKVRFQGNGFTIQDGDRPIFYEYLGGR